MDYFFVVAWYEGNTSWETFSSPPPLFFLLPSSEETCRNPHYEASNVAVINFNVIKKNLKCLLTIRLMGPLRTSTRLLQLIPPLILKKYMCRHMHPKTQCIMVSLASLYKVRLNAIQIRTRVRGEKKYIHAWSNAVTSIWPVISALRAWKIQYNDTYTRIFN